MHRAIVLSICLLLAVAALQAQGAAPSSPAGQILSLNQATVGDEVLLAFVSSASTPFSLSVDDLIALKNGGVSAAVLVAILKHDASLRVATPVATLKSPILPTVDYSVYPYAYPLGPSFSLVYSSPYRFQPYYGYGFGFGGHWGRYYGRRW